LSGILEESNENRLKVKKGNEFSTGSPEKKDVGYRSDKEESQTLEDNNRRDEDLNNVIWKKN